MPNSILSKLGLSKLGLSKLGLSKSAPSKSALIPFQARTRSDACYQRATQLLPGGVNSPVRAFKRLEMLPLIAASGAGDLLFDLEGNSWIDFCGGWGTLIHGHAHPHIVKVLQEQATQGLIFGLTTELEVILAEKVTSYLPSIEKVRFVATGTEATMSVVRLARGFTRRKLIVKFEGNFHGHADSFLLNAGSGLSYLAQASSQGLLEESAQFTLSLPYNDIEAARALFAQEGHSIAAVIVEPIAANMGLIPATPAFLEMLREETQRVGALLIFDEIVTGFRVGLGGAQELYKITPDLTCLGKVLGGGMPLAAFGGSAEVMDLLAPLGPVYQSGTFAGHPLSIAAGVATLDLLNQGTPYKKLQEKQEFLTQPLQEKLANCSFPACLQQVGSMFTLFLGIERAECFSDLQKIDHALFKKCYHFLFERGVYLSPSPFEVHFVSLAHTPEHLALTRDLLLEMLETLTAP